MKLPSFTSSFKTSSIRRSIPERIHFESSRRSALSWLPKIIIVGILNSSTIFERVSFKRLLVSAGGTTLSYKSPEITKTSIYLIFYQ